MGLAVLWMVLTGCGGGPVFDKVEDIEVRQLDPTGGLGSYHIDRRVLPEFEACLKETREIPAEQLEDKLLPNAYLIAVDDARGKRSFELLSKRNLSDSDGKYYANSCLFPLIRKVERLQ